jgi:uncharacterized protein (DUF1330 family)
MAAYLIAQWKVGDRQTFQRYRDQLRPLVDRFGGRFRVEDDAVEVLEGDPMRATMLVIEMPTRGAARLLYNSPEYEPLRGLREQAAQGSLWLVGDG